MEFTQNQGERYPSDGPDQSVGQRLSGKYITFKLATEDYGIEIQSVREIIGLMQITRVPRTAYFVRGVINLRGKVIPVLDLRHSFGMGRLQETEQTVIIVVQCSSGGRELTMGLLVDEVLEVLNITPDSIEPPPGLANDHSDEDFILGVGKSGERIVFLLDIATVLARPVTEETQGVTAEP